MRQLPAGRWAPSREDTGLQGPPWKPRGGSQPSPRLQDAALLAGLGQNRLVLDPHTVPITQSPLLPVPTNEWAL